ncbi:isochorismatase family protein [Bradyrhizobium sp.]|uniref:isochorismatase family protein n=1 Tax=Bradyrhizobium sp. TaxID=376 RepID=UPI004037EB9F
MIPGAPALNPADPPILVCADLQVQHLCGHGSAGDAVARCLALLELWRAQWWPVLHLKRIAQAAWFDRGSQLTEWAAEFRPQPGEMVFEHPLPSAYSSSRFADYMASMRSVHCLVAGCSLDETILATVIEGYHRGHRFCVAGDAVTCAHSAADGAEEHCASMLRAIGKFACIERGVDLIEAAASEA